MTAPSVANSSTAMTAFAASIASVPSTLDSEAIRTYLQDILEGTTPAPLGFGRVNVGATPTLNIVLINKRFRPVTYRTPTIGAGDFSIVAESCAGTSRVVPATGSCTISIQFTPTGLGLKTASVGVQFVADGVDPQPLDRTVAVDGTANAAPVAAISAPSTAITGSPVAVTGSATDANGDSLTYTYTLVPPSGSLASLLGSLPNSRSFTPDVRGAYQVSLVVSDGLASSAMVTSTTTAAPPNTPPVANAGPPQSVRPRATVALDGSASRDAELDPLTYAWSLSRPAGSLAVLSNSTSVNPTFVADVVGSFVATLVVRDGMVNSAPSTVTITIVNATPVANAGPAQSVRAGAAVTLDGSASSDADHDPLTYLWSLTKPAASTATLSSTTAARPLFTPDIAGTYTATLVVNDGTIDSSPSSVVITVGGANTPPVANAGPVQSIVAGATVVLDGSGSSDAERDPLTYAWTLSTRPAGSTAVLTNATSVNPTFVADLTGTYVATLVVNDSTTSSSAASVTITSRSPLSLSTTTLNVAANVGAYSTASAVVTNIGSTSFSLTGLTFGGAASTDYTLAPSNTCAIGLVLAASSSCTLAIQFTPPLAGTRAATLLLASGAPGGTQSIVLDGTATIVPQGRIALGSMSLAFSDTQVGAGSTLSVAVANSGTAPLRLSALTIAGAAAADFTRTGDCSVGTPIAVGAQCTLTVTFRPSAVGSRAATLTIASDASNGAAVVTLAGTGTPVPAPQVAFSSAVLAFGDQTVGGLYPARTVTLSNTGTADLSIASIVVDTGVYSNANPASCPATLAAGASCTISITFTPTAANISSTGTLRVTSNAAGSPSLVPLTGQGTARSVPLLTWAPAVTRLDFGTISAGSVSTVQSVTLLNQGPGGITFSLINAVGADAAMFSATSGTCAIGVPLFEGQTCTIDVRFAPASAGIKSAALQVISTGSLPATLAIAGTGLAGPGSTLSVSSTTLNFEATRVGAQSLPQDVVLTATGSGVVSVSALQVSGAYTVQTKSCPAVPFSLSAGGACTVTITFVPPNEGAFAGTLRVISDASQAAPDVSLVGQGTPKPDVSRSGGGGSGCSIASGDSPADPTLWALLLLAVAALSYRRAGRRPRPRPDGAGHDRP